ncbi:MAG: hypothetical protein UY26_C0002G0116 [Candidatus Jorgensenbacteria bacterium GW2011_GWA1_48_13]|nr:MAG: hypothetical protein UY26_C0002G0116 [Candidatus Jorgensenbacteria bacterium GW2011_GWA1_48_13]KKW15395.1 MAG: hypothetical protein UY55_C0001G0149 [Candidatus Jorgensenbacteria bacterium GW2011_GWB1_50_10]
MISIIIAGIFALVALVRFVPDGSASDANPPGKAEPRNTWVLAIVAEYQSRVSIEDDYVDVDVVWEIAEGPDTRRLMFGTINRLRVAKSNPRLKELVPGAAVFIPMSVDKLTYDSEKYTSYTRDYNSEPLTEFRLYREYHR